MKELILQPITEEIKPKSDSLIGRFTVGDVDTINERFGLMFSKRNIEPFSPAEIQNLKSLEAQFPYTFYAPNTKGIFTEYVSNETVDYREYNFFDLAIYNRSKSKTLYCFPFPHIEHRANLKFFQTLVDTIEDMNIVFILGNKAIFPQLRSNENEVTTGMIDQELTGLISGLIAEMESDYIILNSTCFGHLLSHSIIPLFDKLISYSPMVVKSNFFTLDVDDVTFTGKHFPIIDFFHLFNIAQNRRALLAPIPLCLDVIDWNLYKQYYAMFRTGKFTSSKGDNVLIHTPEDKIVSLPDNDFEKWSKIITLESPQGIGLHGANFVFPDSISEYVNIIHEESNNAGM